MLEKRIFVQAIEGESEVERPVDLEIVLIGKPCPACMGKKIKNRCLHHHDVARPAKMNSWFERNVQ